MDDLLLGFVLMTILVPIAGGIGFKWGYAHGRVRGAMEQARWQRRHGLERTRPMPLAEDEA